MYEKLRAQVPQQSNIIDMINSRMLTIKWPTWLEDHWAAAMAVLATEKALTRFPSGSNKSLTKAKGRVSKQTCIPTSEECGRLYLLFIVKDIKQ